MWGAGRLAAAAFVIAVVVAMAVNPGRPTQPYRAAADEEQTGIRVTGE